MSLANDIIQCKMPDFDYYLKQGESLDDIDEYGFTPLIECAITRQVHIAKALLARGVNINKPDVTGRTPLHWAVDNEDLPMVQLLLEHRANPNAYTLAGLSILVYPLLRGQDDLKRLLYQHAAKPDFALDFIHGKLLGHRYELTGDVDIVNAEGEFIELDYEGFMLEFTVSLIYDSLRRFTSSYSTRHLRAQFHSIYSVMDAFMVASKLLKLQRMPHLQLEHKNELNHLIQAPLLVLPAASRGHAMCFIRYGHGWAKIDRGENSQKEGSVNLYLITRPDRFNADFVAAFLYKKQPRRFFHETINTILGLQPIGQITGIAPQISGNCSWANIQAALPVALALQSWVQHNVFSEQAVLSLYDEWVEWDRDRALDECIQRFYLADRIRKASFASMLAAVLFQRLDYDKVADIARAEKILAVLTVPEYHYILNTYLDIYCVKRLTRRGNNLLKILDDCDINPNIGVTPIATGLTDKNNES